MQGLWRTANAICHAAKTRRRVRHRDHCTITCACVSRRPRPSVLLLLHSRPSFEVQQSATNCLQWQRSRLSFQTACSMAYNQLQLMPMNTIRRDPNQATQCLLRSLRMAYCRILGGWEVVKQHWRPPHLYQMFFCWMKRLTTKVRRLLLVCDDRCYFLRMLGSICQWADEEPTVGSSVSQPNGLLGGTSADEDNFTVTSSNAFLPNGLLGGTSTEEEVTEKTAFHMPFEPNGLLGLLPTDEDTTMGEDTSIREKQASTQGKPTFFSSPIKLTSDIQLATF